MSKENVTKEQFEEAAERAKWTDEEIDDLQRRLESVEAEHNKLKTIITDGYEFAAEQVRPIFGWGQHVSRLFQAIADRLKKDLF